ncbi:MAG TPA: ABC transporter permease [Acidimicrobiia bacterium]|nr:ABC transporter permease [Acidimicrobiia bacterium]
MSDLRRPEQVAEPDTEFAGHTEVAEELVEPPQADPAGTTSLWSDAWRELRSSPLFLASLALVVLFGLMAAAPQLFTSADPRSCVLSNSLQRPSAEHWFGFDLQGCDYYARTVYGARISMSIGVTVIAFAAFVAIVLGSIAGYFGGVLDAVIARITDIWFAIPTILGGIVILSLLGNRGFFQVSLVLVILGWPTMLRLYRSSVLSVKEMDYVEAARALGASDFRILTKHILPNAITPVIIYGAISIGVIISAEAALSFLGVGLQLPAISWGLMISGAQTRILQAPHLLLFPGLFLSLAVFGFILMGDALRDALDPKGR